jgi:signal peptidase I
METESQTWKQKLVHFWKNWGWIFVVTILVTTSFRSAIADWNDVPTGSMIPTILEGDRIFVNKLAYDLKVPYTTWHIAQWDDPKRGEIVVFFSPKDEKRLVKRVIGLPGDQIAMVKERLFINGQAVEYEQLSQEAVRQLMFEPQGQSVFFNEYLADRTHPVMIIPNIPALRTFGPVTVPAGQYFLMGDNRDNSADSRYFGFVERRRIVGRATNVVLSLNYKHYYLPRWNRFWHPLP